MFGFEVLAKAQPFYQLRFTPLARGKMARHDKTRVGNLSPIGAPCVCRVRIQVTAYQQSNTGIGDTPLFYFITHNIHLRCVVLCSGIYSNVYLRIPIDLTESRGMNFYLPPPLKGQGLSEI